MDEGCVLFRGGRVFFWIIRKGYRIDFIWVGIKIMIEF